MAKTSDFVVMSTNRILYDFTIYLFDVRCAVIGLEKGNVGSSLLQQLKNCTQSKNQKQFL